MYKKTLIAALVSCVSILSAEPVCHKCEEIREANKHRTDNYEYYDDYLKDHPNANTPKQDGQTADAADKTQKPAKPKPKVQKKPKGATGTTGASPK